MTKASEGKAVDAFRTISEVAEELDVQKHVLRFWEVKFPQIRPMKRGGGRRYYRPTDMELLLGIRKLLHSDGYTIKGVQRILREKGVDAVKRLGATTRSPGEAPVAADPAPVATARPAKPAASSKTPPRAAESATASARSDAHVPITLPAELRGRLLSIVAELKDCRLLLIGDEAGLAKAVARRETGRARAAG